MGAPAGNNNAIKQKPWADAIRRALARADLDESPRSLNNLAEKLLEKALEGDLAALRELGDRLDGKPAQSIVGDADAPPVKMEIGWTKSP